jgi:hypothetical protein
MGIEADRVEQRCGVEGFVGGSLKAYALRLAAGASEVKKDSQAQFNWAKKWRRRSLLWAGRNAISSGLVKSVEIIKQLPKLALRLCDVKMIEVEKGAKRRAKAA